MTRETKIGLLVGLAFIIVIGILLSDHLTSSTEPPPAPMSQAGPNVRSGVSTPIRPQESPVVQATPPQVQPSEPVRTADDLTPRPQPVKLVRVTAPQQGEPLTITSPDDSTTPSPVATASPESTTPPPVALRPGTPTFRTNDPILARLNEEAKRLGESVVPVGGPSGTPSTVTAARTYKAEPGDSLSKIATKMYGSGGRGYKDAIIEANPSLKANPDLVIEGRTYQIPAMMKPVAFAEAPSIAPQQSKPAPADSAATYVVLEGDNLTRIATEQCGSAGALAAIKELNRELLKGADVIRPGMKLKLPARSVAVNN